MIQQVAAAFVLTVAFAIVAMAPDPAPTAEEREIAEAIAAEERDGFVVRCVRADTESGCARDSP